ncbi:hypothetical protein SISNIDRAFT_259651 [Sistotremastrum niveocremeum HHB9708]|uniref:Uncharacterized protein n=1 Tax=Sistotremastrum niveocremeum HHB9708 TaxID=1314777 RepID=A0A164P990_9AGAM|nr:hypothetical protein SISNIDRAFT_259651 [Sistotremastrum niveocremeum HHB9708]
MSWARCLVQSLGRRLRRLTLGIRGILVIRDAWRVVSVLAILMPMLMVAIPGPAINANTHANATTNGQSPLWRQMQQMQHVNPMNLRLTIPLPSRQPINNDPWRNPPPAEGAMDVDAKNEKEKEKAQLREKMIVLMRDLEKAKGEITRLRSEKLQDQMAMKERMGDLDGKMKLSNEMNKLLLTRLDEMPSFFANLIQQKFDKLQDTVATPQGLEELKQVVIDEVNNRQDLTYVEVREHSDILRNIREVQAEVSRVSLLLYHIFQQPPLSPFLLPPCPAPIQHSITLSPPRPSLKRKFDQADLSSNETDNEADEPMNPPEDSNPESASSEAQIASAPIPESRPTKKLKLARTIVPALGGMAFGAIGTVALLCSVLLPDAP